MLLACGLLKSHLAPIRREVVFLVASDGASQSPEPRRGSVLENQAVSVRIHTLHGGSFPSTPIAFHHHRKGLQKSLRLEMLWPGFLKAAETRFQEASGG